MAADSVQSVRTGTLKLIPSNHDHTWYRFLENSRDWCISRQLWWGHRIPAYYATVNDGRKVSPNDGQYWISGRTLEEATQRACSKFEVTADQITLVQDEDVLDTWFSSALFPFSVFGWPNQTADLETFYPTSLLETGHDILFFWVARMSMMGKKLTGKLPFKEVYLHAMVRDAYGRKMSKSLGNIVDPIDVIEGITLQALSDKLEEYNLEPKELEKARKGQDEMYGQTNGIPECGTDALRFALCAYTAQGRDINLDVLRIQGYRHFCNKLWNATRFAMQNFSPTFKPEQDQMKLSDRTTKLDQWILSRLAFASASANQGFSTYDFPKATTAIYNFWLYELCDIYLESLKPIFQGSDEVQKECAQNVLLTCLDNGLRLLAPFMPFITEELYQRLPRRAGNQPESVCVAPYPKATLKLTQSLCSSASINNFADLNTDSGLAALNDHLVDKPYLGGFHPTSTDVAVFSQLSTAPPSKHSHALRWWSHIKSFSAQEMHMFKAGESPFIEDAKAPLTGSKSTGSSNAQDFASWFNTSIERGTDAMMEVVKAIRSMKEQYLNSKAKPTVYLRPLGGSTTAEDYKDVISTLAQVSCIEILAPDAPAPSGCAMSLAGTSFEVFLLLKGLVDFEKEIVKLTGEVKKTKKQFDTLQQNTERPDYETKVPDNVRQQNTEKLNKLTLEMEKLNIAVDNFQKCLAET